MPRSDDQKPRKKRRSTADRILAENESMARQLAPLFEAQAHVPFADVRTAGMDMDDVRSMFGAAQALKYTSVPLTARDHLEDIMGDWRSMAGATEAYASACNPLEALMDDVLGDHGMADAFSPPSAADTLRKSIDEVLRSTGIEPAANLRAGLDALSPPNPARLASDLTLNTVTVLADSGLLSAVQIAEATRALDPPQVHMQHLIGSLTLQLEALMPMPTAPFRDTVHELLAADYGIEAMADAVATDSLHQQLATVLEAAGLTPWIESLHQTLAQPESSEVIGQWRSAGEQVTAELQTLLARELYEQPDWRTLFESASGVRPGLAEEEATAPKTRRTTRLRLMRQFMMAYRKVTGLLAGKGIPLKPSPAFPWGLFGVLISTLLTLSTCTQNSREHADIRSDNRQIRNEIQALRQDRRWLLGRHDRIALRASPFVNANRVTLHGPIVLLEKQTSDDWMEVTIYDCDGKNGSGWVLKNELERLDSTAEPTCPPDHGPVAPVLIVEAGARAQEAWQEFFLAQLPNPNTRQAYGRACTHFFDWCRAHGLLLQNIRAAQVAIWRDELAKEKSTATVKQYLTAVRRLLDELVINQVIEVNPAHPVRAPRLSRARTRTASLSALELRHLFAAFDTSQIIDIRDRAVLAVMTFYMARVSAVCSMPVKDIELGGEQPHMILNEKRGRQHRLPLNTTMVEWIGEWVEAAGISRKVDAPLFQSFGQGRGTSEVTGRQLGRQDVYSIIRRRFEKAGLDRRGGCHTLRATGITLLLSNGTPIEQVSELAGHASVDMTRRYDGRDWEEVQKVLGKMG